MVVAIVGSMGFSDRAAMLRVVAGLREEFGETLEIISGGAPGADTLAIECAMVLGVREREIRPDETRWGALAHSRRNQALADAAELVVAFFAPGPRTPGTSETLRMAAARGIPARVFHDGRWTAE